MVDIVDIPDFPGQPGQRPPAGVPAAETPVTAILVTAPLDREYKNIAVNRAAVDDFIAAEVIVGRAHTVDVARWSPWSPLQLQLSYAVGVRFNYARFSIGDRYWYGFLDAQYLNLTDTAYTVTPDNWTTYEPSIGYSNVRRGHVAVAASSGGNIGYCLEPEEFSPADLIGYNSYTVDPLGTPRVLVVSTTDLTADPFVQVDNDYSDTITDAIGQTLAAGTIEAPQPIPADPISFGYAVGNGTFDDLFYYPYGAAGSGSSRTMYRPRAVGATPSLIDGILAEGGAFVYESIGAAASHLSKLAHAPWIADGIQRAILIPGGSGGGFAPVDLSPRNSVPGFDGAPTYYSTLTTEIASTTTVAADWTDGLPAAYSTWTKPRTGPYAAIQIADRLGSVSEYDPQEITDLNALRVRVEGVFHPTPDVAAWVLGAGGTTAPANPITVPLGATSPYYAVGRDSALAAQAAGIAAERSQSIVDMLLAIQRGTLDNTMTVASAFTATQFAIVEAV